MATPTLFPEDRRRELFPFVDEQVYLAAAAETPLAAPAFRALADFHAGYARRGCRDFPRWLAELERCRASLARLIGAAGPEEIALVKNTASAARFVAHSLPLEEGDRVLTNACEFPSNLWPWEDAARLAGARVERLAPEGWRVPASLAAARLADPGEPPPRAVTWSWVQYRDGFRVDPAALVAAARPAGAAVALDGIQGLGAVPFSLREMPVDAVYAGGHKWLMGLAGAGFLWVRPGCFPGWRLFGRGWLSVPDPMAMDPDAIPFPGVRRFEEGSPAYGLYHALRAAVDLLLEVGVEEIFAHVTGLLDRLLEAVEPKGYRARSSRVPAERGPILALETPGIDPEDLARDLNRRDVFLTARDGCLRVAPHLYNTAAEMDLLAELLPECPGA